MTNQAEVALVTLLGVVVGGTLTGMFAWIGDRRRIRTEDATRWLADRRNSYARFLGLAESMLREVDGFAIFLIDDNGSISDEDEEFIKGGLLTYQIKWDEVLQPALGEIQLLASPKVAELAERVSGALMEVTSEVETRGSFNDYYPAWFQATDLVHVTRDAMRSELGIESLGEEIASARRDANWPWLDSRPGRSTYIQNTQQDGP